MFTASDGNSKFPFHILLADSMQANNASKTMAEILNRLGISSSLSTVKENMDLVTSGKILSTFVNDFIEDSWTIASLDNVDIDQPHAHFNNQQRGLHATSMQALHPNKSIKLHPDELIDEISQTHMLLPYNLDDMFKDFSVDDVLHLTAKEMLALANMSEEIFVYMNEKVCAPESCVLENLKARISKFTNNSTEAGKAIYLGFLMNLVIVTSLLKMYWNASMTYSKLV